MDIGEHPKAPTWGLEVVSERSMGGVWPYVGFDSQRLEIHLNSFSAFNNLDSNIKISFRFLSKD